MTDITETAVNPPTYAFVPVNGYSFNDRTLHNITPGLFLIDTANNRISFCQLNVDDRTVDCYGKWTALPK
jgi:hypothetical protein